MSGIHVLNSSVCTDHKPETSSVDVATDDPLFISYSTIASVVLKLLTFTVHIIHLEFCENTDPSSIAQSLHFKWTLRCSQCCVEWLACEYHGHTFPLKTQISEPIHINLITISNRRPVTSLLKFQWWFKNKRKLTSYFSEPSQILFISSFGCDWEKSNVLTPFIYF
jgi:hypothetical protein